MSWPVSSDYELTSDERFEGARRVAEMDKRGAIPVYKWPMTFTLLGGDE